MGLWRGYARADMSNMTATTERLHSEDVILQAPMSFTGAAKRIWRMTRDHAGVALYGMASVAVLVIACAWILIVGWYLTFGLLLVPYRLIRRGSRRRRLDSMRHREMLIAASKAAQPVSASRDS